MNLITFENKILKLFNFTDSSVQNGYNGVVTKCFGETLINLKAQIQILDFIIFLLQVPMGFPGASVIKNTPASIRDAGDEGSIPGSQSSLGGGDGNLLQYSRLKSSMDRGAWQVTVHRTTRD